MFPVNHLHRRAGSIVVVGSINLDVTIRTERIPTSGETIHGRGPECYPGGKGANQAVAASKLGAKVSMVGAVGTDPYAEVAIQGLQAAGVDLNGLLRLPGPTGMAFITVDDRGNNMIVVTPGANGHLHAGNVSAAHALLEAADILVLQGEIPASGIIRATQLARGRVILNLAPVLDLPAEILQEANPLVVNEFEARLAVRLLTGSSPQPTATDEEVAATLIGNGVAALIMTRGAAGALVMTDSEVTAVPSPAVDAIDTTGAGDAFVGAVAAALATGTDLLEATRFAVRVGAHACTSSGAQPSYPDRDAQLPV